MLAAGAEAGAVGEEGQKTDALGFKVEVDIVAVVDLAAPKVLRVKLSGIMRLDYEIGIAQDRRTENSWRRAFP